MPPELASLVTALHMRDWYAVAALALLVVTQLARKFAPDAWAKIPEGWRGYLVLLAGAVTAFVAAFQAGKPFADALTAAIGGAIAIGMGAMGANAALTDSHLPWNGRAGGKAPPPKDEGPKTPRTGAGAAPLTMLALFVGALAFAPVLVSCSSPSAALKDPAAAGAKARETARVVYLAGSQAIWLLEEARIVWMKSKVSPTASEVEIAEKVGAALHAAKDALDKAKPWLETGAGEAEGKRAIREGVEQAEAVAGLLMAGGAKVPKPVTDGLAAARAALGGDS